MSLLQRTQGMPYATRIRNDVFCISIKMIRNSNGRRNSQFVHTGTMRAKIDIFFLNCSSSNILNLGSVHYVPPGLLLFSLPVLLSMSMPLQYCCRYSVSAYNIMAGLTSSYFFAFQYTFLSSTIRHPFSTSLLSSCIMYNVYTYRFNGRHR